MKNQQTLQRFLCKTKRRIRAHSPTLLTCIGAAGVVLTAVMAVRATPKALELMEEEQARRKFEGETEYYESLPKKDVVKLTWRCYIPAAVTGLSTIACIFGANVLNRRQQAALTSAYALLSSSYREYEGKVKELYGEEAHKNIKDSIRVEHCEKDLKVVATNIISDGSSLDFEDSNEEKRLFYDTFSGRYFETTISRVIQAEYHLNRNFWLKGAVPLNEFYEFLGLEPTDYGEMVGWTNCDGNIYWIDFSHHKAVMDDGLECYIIEMDFESDADFLNDI